MKRKRPNRPYPGFPLFPHANGQWAAKIGGKLVYFGPWEFPQEALREFREYQDRIYLGSPEKRNSEPNVRYLCNDFLTAKEAAVERGELSHRTYRDDVETERRLVRFFGPSTRVDALTPAEFSRLREFVARRWWRKVHRHVLLVNQSAGLIRSFLKNWHSVVRGVREGVNGAVRPQKSRACVFGTLHAAIPDHASVWYIGVSDAGE